MHHCTTLPPSFYIFCMKNVLYTYMYMYNVCMQMNAGFVWGRKNEGEVICAWQREGCICSVWHTVLSLQQLGHSVGTCAKGQNSLSVSVASYWKLIDRRAPLCLCLSLMTLCACACIKLTGWHGTHRVKCVEVGFSTEKRHSFVKLSPIHWCIYTLILFTISHSYK